MASLVPTLDENGVDLVTKMLQYDPARRITAQDALKHPFFYDMTGGMAKNGNGVTKQCYFVGIQLHLIYYKICSTMTFGPKHRSELRYE
eukprot:7573242-Ditylum_brightwellii.AAC.1